MKRYKSVDDFLDSQEIWQSQLIRLREILSATQLEETLKWSIPVYTHNGKNVVGIGGFKSYFGLWFFQGALLSDPLGVLVNAQEGKTEAMRQWRMTKSSEIKVRPIKAYVKEAMEFVDSGREIKPKRDKQLTIPTELEGALSKKPATKRRFDALTVGKKREFCDYVAQAKRDETKLRRIEKILPMIADGVGLNDKYRR